MGTYTLHCGDASLWLYFISDPAVSWVPPPYAVGMRPHSCISFSVNNLTGTYTLHCRDTSPWSYLISRISFCQLMGMDTYFVHRLAVLSRTCQIVTLFHFSRAPTPTHFRRLVSTPTQTSPSRTNEQAPACAISFPITTAHSRYHLSCRFDPNHPIEPSHSRPKHTTVWPPGVTLMS